MEQVNTTISQIEVITFSNDLPKVNAKKNNKLIELYGIIENMPTTKNVIYHTNYRCNLPYVMMPLYESNEDNSYSPIGTFWIVQDGRILIYKPSYVTNVYISGEYLMI